MPNLYFDNRLEKETLLEQFLVSARKYRPATFESVVGQKHITQTLKSAILSHQLAHAYLFSGPRGVGKTTCARILAKAINCESQKADGEPCNECPSCQNYNEGRSLNIHELDAASNNSVDDIRNLIEQVRYMPQKSSSGKEQKSVYIIDEVHMLTGAAFNAFLKTLEEPPSHVLFILATTEKHKILPTVLSRCQKFDFKRIQGEDIAQHLAYISKEEKITYEYPALQLIGIKADGGLRDALSLYDQLVSYSGGNLSYATVLENLNILDYDYYFQVVEKMQAQDHTGLLLLLNEVIEKGFEVKDFLFGLTAHFRNLLICLSPKTVDLLETADNIKEKYLAQSRSVEPMLLLNAFNICTETDQKMKGSSHLRFLVELALYKLAHLQQAIRISTNSDSVQDEKKKSSPLNTTATEVKENPTDYTSAAPITNGAKETMEKVVEKKPVAAVNFNNLEELKKNWGGIQQSKKDAEITPIEEVVIAINTQISIDKQLFSAQFNQFLQQWEEGGKISIVSMLRNSEYHFEYNKWKLSVPSDLYKHSIEQERDTLVSTMRNLSGINDLVLEVNTDKNLQASSPLLMTASEKWKEMMKVNPNIVILQELFKTRIID